MIGLRCDKCGKMLAAHDVDYSNVTAAKVKELRRNTGAEMLECKQALGISGGDMKIAEERLRQRGLAVMRYIVCGDCGCRTSFYKKWETVE